MSVERWPRIGQRMTGSVAKTMMDRFFDCLKQSAS